MDISTNDEATVINIEGVEQNAKEFLCQNKAVVKIALEALRNVFKNPILKMLIGAVIDFFEKKIEKTCE